MSYSSLTTTNTLFLVSENITRCLSLWRNVQSLCHGQESMSSEVIRDMSGNLENTLRSGEGIIRNFIQGPSQNKAAFEKGDDESHRELQNVINNQKSLIQTLEDIKTQLTDAFQPQSSPRNGPRRAPNPERVLDIARIWNITESVNDHIHSTSDAMENLRRRIEVRPMPVTPQKTQAPPVSGSFPVIESYAHQQNPSLKRSAPTPFMSDTGGLTTPTLTPTPILHLRPQQPPQQPPRPQESASPIRPPEQVKHVRNRSVETRQVPINTSPPAPLQNISDQPGTYCTGAFRLQRDQQLSIADIVQHNHSAIGINAPSICKHCNLELDTSLPGMILPEETQRTMIARQHILACASLEDRRAMFRCLTCSKADKDAEFRVVGELWEHSHTHTQHMMNN